jgi:hypothetical protein
MPCCVKELALPKIPFLAPARPGPEPVCRAVQAQEQAAQGKEVAADDGEDPLPGAAGAHCLTHAG